MFPTFVAAHLVSTLVHMGNQSHRTQCCLNETYCISIDTNRYPDILMTPSPSSGGPSLASDPSNWAPPELHSLPTFNQSKSSFLQGFQMNKFHGIDQIYRYLEAVTESSKLAKLLNLGFTFESRPLLGLLISSRVRPDPRDPEAPPIVFIVCGFRGREWIAPASCLLIIHHLISHYDRDNEVRRMVDDFEWRIFPCMNPDGYAYSMSVDRKWKKNRSKRPKTQAKSNEADNDCSGVDLNRNFNTSHFCEGVQEGREDPHNRYFTCLARYRKRNFTGSMRVRLLWPAAVLRAGDKGVTYRNTTLSSEDRRRLELLSRGAVDEISKIKGGYGKWKYGSSAELLGYNAPGASADWAFDVAKIFYSFAVELGPHSSVGEHIGYTLSEQQIPRSATELWVGLKFCTLNY